MGTVMSALLCRFLPLLLVAFVASVASITGSAGAQLMDPADSRSNQAEPPPPTPAPAPARTRAPEQAAPTNAPPLEPPRWIAKAPQAPVSVGEPTPTEDRNPLLILFLSLLGVGVVLFIAERARSWITSNIPLRRVLGALVFGLRLVGLGLLDIFADVVAGGILAAERRVKKGMWVSGDGFQGTVEGRSLRATWLRDGQGHRLTVPNRAMVGAPMVYDAGADAEHEVVVRLEGYDDAGKVRMALTDAILSSPWVLAGATPVVLRDPADPVVWRVRTKLLEPRFSVRFEGELLERVEDLLRHEPAEERDTAPRESPET